MQFIKDSTEGANVITGMDAGAIRINDQIHQGSLIIRADSIESWSVADVGQINQTAWQAILATSPELIILGTGDQLIFPEPVQLKAVYERNIGIEVMDSRAACRTFNLLVHEGRNVTVALILLDKSD